MLFKYIASNISVTSLAEVWIETVRSLDFHSWLFVTSLAEVWIETNCLG